MRNVAWNIGRQLVVIVLPLLVSACALLEPSPSSTPVRLTGVLTGTATYRERIALLPGAVLRARLEDVGASSAVIATAVSKPERQVPLSFTLAYDPARIDPTHQYAVHVQIESPNGQALWMTTERYGVITRGNPTHVDVLLHPVRSAADVKGQSEEEATNGRTFAYQCEGMAFTIRNGPSMVALYLPNDYRVLSQVRSASGVRYQDGEMQYWSKGNEAMLDIGSRHYTGCKLDAARTAQEDAKLRRVSVRASGHEPQWSLDIEKGRWLRFVGEAEGSSVYLPAQHSTIDGERTIYQAKSAMHDLQVTVERADCMNVVSGKKTDAKVTVSLNGREYHGCGQAME